MGKLTISMAIFNSYVKLPEGICLVTLGYQRAKHTYFDGVTKHRTNLEVSEHQTCDVT